MQWLLVMVHSVYSRNIFVKLKSKNFFGKIRILGKMWHFHGKMAFSLNLLAKYLSTVLMFTLTHPFYFYHKNIWWECWHSSIIKTRSTYEQSNFNINSYVLHRKGLKTTPAWSWEKKYRKLAFFLSFFLHFQLFALTKNNNK